MVTRLATDRWRWLGLRRTIRRPVDKPGEELEAIAESVPGVAAQLAEPPEVMAPIGETVPAETVAVRGRRAEQRRPEHRSASMYATKVREEFDRMVEHLRVSSTDVSAYWES